MDNMNTSCFPIALSALKKANTALDEIDNLDIVKSFTYTGTGSEVNVITFPTVPKAVLSIYSNRGIESNDYVIECFAYGQPRVINDTLSPSYTSSTGPRMSSVTYNSNVLTITSDTPSHSVNTLDDTYTVYYI